jgi:glutaminyl-tRNA synthetase
VRGGHVRDFDDPRLFTLAGLRRRGYTPEAIKNFCAVIGINKFYSVIDVALLEHCLREDLNKTSPRVMAVLKPLKVIIINWPQGQVEQLDAVNNPEDSSAGTRKVPFGRELYIEQDDFMENPPPKFYRLSPGREVRLRYAYFIKCTNVVKDNTGKAVELHCTYDSATKGGDAPDGRKVKSTIHWLSAPHAIPAEVRLYNNLFTKENPDDVPARLGEGADVATEITESPSRSREGKDFTVNLNPNSLEVLQNCLVEPALKDAKPSSRYQFERLGYFCVDPDSKSGKLVFNRTVTLRDEWAKIQKQQPHE